MENIDVTATLELIAAIAIVAGLVATFFKKTAKVPGEAIEQVPYKVEAPVVEVSQVAVVEAAEASAVTVKPTRAKKPVAKRVPAKKTAKKKPTAE
jgi:hypothetical protein